jgi:exopolyphosphatase / guanosine-5'-triphosphate,3'-diphosphate pyrophosphatase
VSQNYAIISVGTNSARVLLADVASETPRVRLAQAIGTRIGEGLGESGRLGDEPVSRTLDAIARLQRAVRGHYVRLFAIATSALRRAENAAEFLERVRDLLGVSMRVLSGDEEAEASYRGAVTVFGSLRGERTGVVDVGGGSTEYAVGASVTPERVVSCEIGAVRLTEAVPALAGRDGAVGPAALEQARAIAVEALAPLAESDANAAAERIALVGGSATTTAAIVRGRRGAIGSFTVTRANLRDVLARLCAMSLEERKVVVGMKPQRADILPGGIIVLDTALEVLGLDSAVATTSDLLLGYLLTQRVAAGPTAAGVRPPLPAGSETRRGYR